MNLKHIWPHDPGRTKDTRMRAAPILAALLLVYAGFQLLKSAGIIG